jgi:hypothetical protein
MNKKFGNNIKALIAAGIIASVVGGMQVKTYALTADELFTQAYNNVINTQQQKSQKSINEARISIEALRNTGAEWAIGEFSKQIDQIQHPFLVKIVDSINTAKLTIKQSDINAAIATIDPELPDVWKFSYSSAVDAVQQDLQRKLINSYHNAAYFETEETMAEFEAVLSEIKTSINPQVVQWADMLTSPMRSVWNNADLKDIYNMLVEINDGVGSGSYSQQELILDTQDMGAVAFYDVDKVVKNITSMSEYNMHSMFYSNDQLVNVTDFSAEQPNLIMHQAYFKAGKLIKWISIVTDITEQNVTAIPEMSVENIKAINVYDESSLPQELKNKLLGYQNESGKLITDAKNQIK